MNNCGLPCDTGMFQRILAPSTCDHGVCAIKENPWPPDRFRWIDTRDDEAGRTLRTHHPRSSTSRVDRSDPHWQCSAQAGGSVAAKFEVTAYSKLAPGRISNLCIFEYTYVYSNIHGHFVDDYRIWTPFHRRPVNSKLWVSANL
jgi:hypothetical protein